MIFYCESLRCGDLMIYQKELIAFECEGDEILEKNKKEGKHMRSKSRVLAAFLAMLMLVSTIVGSITPVKAAEGLTVGTYYTIVSKKSRMAMTVEGYSSANDAGIIQMPLGNYEAQVWQLQDGGDGYYKLVSYVGNKALDVPWASTAEGVQPALWNSGNGDNQKWGITEVEDGYYRITPKLVDTFGLNVEGNSTDRGANIIQWTYAGADNEKWSFIPVAEADIQPNPGLEAPLPVSAIDAYIDAFFYVEDGVGKLRNEPSNGFWTDAEILEVFIDAYERYGVDQYKTVVSQFFDGIISRRGTDWSWNGFNDDIMWMVIASARAYLLTGEQKYLTAAVDNFDMCYNRSWDTSFMGGGLWWTTDNTSKNACVNGPGAIAACLLGEATGDAAYYTKAQEIIDWEYANFVQTSGAVWDSFHVDGSHNEWASTYNQGTFIGACAMLYQYTGNSKYFDWAKLVADYSAGMGDGSEGYLNREQNGGDLIGFKGILGRWMGYFARECDVDDYNEWMYANAASAWTNRNRDNLMWTQFGRLTEEDLQNSDTSIGDNNTISKYAAWGCSAAVSWLLNTPMDASQWSVVSPDGGTIMNITLSDAGKLNYTVTQDGAVIVENSELGINTSVGDFTTGLTFQSEENKTINETYEMLSGKKDVNTNHCVEKTIHLTKGGVQFDVVARAYDDGIAFRYIITADGRQMTVSPGGEKTTINLPGGAQIWYMNHTNTSFMYEEEYETGIIGELAVGIQPSMPTIYKTGDKFALITEADRHGTYVGSVLKHEGDGVMRAIFDPAQTSAISTATPFTSPWRTIIIGSANDIMQNTMVENLSPAPDASYDFESWVEPGVSSWSWVSYYGGQEDPEIHKKFIDLAADMGWEYYILDEKWQPASSTSGSRYEGMWDWFGEVRDYADEKGVKLFAWVDKSDVDTDAEREARFKEWSEAGIVGIKVDFFYNESQAMLQLHDDIYADAAKYKLMVNVHGSNPPSGELRTYPNVIAREAIRGQEQGGITAQQYTLIPFIRAAVGTADVTEQLYSRDTSKTTMGFQIALSTLIENGLHSMGSKPEEYYSIPAAVSYYTNFPTKWNELYVIGADIGEQVNLARRSTDAWYAAGISVDARTFSYQPSFLDENTTYTAVIYKEKAGERQDIEMVVQNDVTVNSSLTVDVAAGGGYAIKFVPQNDSSLTAITAEPAEITVETYYSETVKLNFTPEDTISTDVTWSVADESIAKITATTGSGVTIKGLKAGTTTVTAASIYDADVKAVINVTVTAGQYQLDDTIWEVINNNYNYIITGENEVQITAKNGVIKNDVFAMRVLEGDEDFEITAKISGGLNANYQGGFIGVFTKGLGTYASIGRRYHTMFNSGGNTPNNHIAMMSNSTELYGQEANSGNDVYVRLVKAGDTFTGYYRYNENDEWTLSNTITHATLANNDELYVGFYAGCGGSTNETTITISDFTYNGAVVNVATETIIDVPATEGFEKYEAEGAVLTGGAAAVDASGNSGGQYAGNIGGPNSGTATFNIASENPGTATLNVYYATWSKRSLSVVVNGTAYNVDCAATGDWTLVGEPITLEVKVAAGDNTIALTGVNGAYAPNIDYIEIKLPPAAAAEGSNEMENGTISGEANVVNSINCSNGQYVGNVGGPNNGTVTYAIESETAGTAALEIYYASWSARPLAVVVNGTTYKLDCAGTGDWDKVGEPIALTVEVNAGNNVIEFMGTDGAYAPNLDRFEIELPASEEETTAPEESSSEEETTAPEESSSESETESSEESSESTEEPEVPVVTPTKVTGLQAVYENGQIKLTWEDNGAARYRVMRFDGITPGYTTLTYRATADGYADTDLIDVHRYYYRVCGYFYDADGNLVQGGVSDAVGMVATDRAPSKVENVRATITDGNVTLTWDAADGVRYYKIARAYGATAAEGSYACIQYNVEETTYTDTTVSAGKWRYKVVGYYKAVDNSWVYGDMSATLFLTVE